MSSHEDFGREQHVDQSSDRNFGLVFAAVFAVIALWPLIHGEPIRWWLLSVGLAFALIAIFRPSVLAVPNKAWAQLGLLLGRIVSPVALAVLFLLVFAPIGALIRLGRKDPLRLKWDPSAPSYWIVREPPGPKPDSLENQF